MADLKKLKKVRGTTTASVSILIAKYKDIFQENYGDQEDELMAMLESLKDKQSDLKKINRDIVELLSEDELENEATQNDEIDMNIRLSIQKISKELKSKKSKDKELQTNTTAVNTTGMKLPKFTLTAFNGDPLKWTSFIEAFDAAVDSQESLSVIEKFSNLTCHLEGPAADCVRDFSLTSKIYIEARKLLEERFGNMQVIISAHMNVLLKLPKLNNNNVAKLTSFYNAIESNIRSLMTMRLNSSHYGPLLIPVMMG